jgi:hypothetical protein
MPVIKTPSGQSVTLKDVKEFTHGDRKKVMRYNDDASRAEQAFDLMDNLLAVAIVEWSYDALIPSVKRESLDALTPLDYDFIRDAAAPLVEAMNPDVSGSGDADPKAPTSN